MARYKVKLAYIVNDAKRRAAFRKRRKGLMKKVSELSTLCGVTACAIVYGPDDPQPQVWPEQPDVHRTLMRFKSLTLLEQNSRQFNQEDFMNKRIGKITTQYNKLRQQNRYMEINQIYNLAMDGTCSILVHDYSAIVDLLWLLDEKKKEVQRKLLGLKNAPTNIFAANTSSGVFTTTNSLVVDFINTNVNVGFVNGSGITGVTGGGVYSGFVNHYRQGDVIFNGTGTSIPQSDGQMVNYLDGGYKNNNSQMMMMGGRVPKPSYNGGTGTSAYIFNNNSAGGGGGVPTPSYNGGTGTFANIFNNNSVGGVRVPTPSYNEGTGTLANIFDKNSAREGGVPPPSYNGVMGTWVDIFKNNSAGGGGVSPPSYNEGTGTLADIVNINNNNNNNNTWMMPAINSYVPMNNM
ncbi:hypothetical protein MKW94_023647 [Papaver nudicaule]|uniref:MADS-box domain-containing protein n=1 Tax=Papaver nudicaule TaxID=74823 RepID=A0AA41SNV6_PAPNU|nr:hypothetical protein [Papaver nudicaule]